MLWKLLREFGLLSVIFYSSLFRWATVLWHKLYTGGFAFLIPRVKNFIARIIFLTICLKPLPWKFSYSTLNCTSFFTILASCVLSILNSSAISLQLFFFYFPASGILILSSKVKHRILSFPATFFAIDWCHLVLQQFFVLIWQNFEFDYWWGFELTPTYVNPTGWIVNCTNRLPIRTKG